MIFYNESTNDWEFHTLKATYVDSSTGEPVTLTEYVTNRRPLEERVRQWPNLTELFIRSSDPTPEQYARLNDINAAHVEMQQEAYVVEYVQYGFISAPLDAEGVPEDTGHTYLNTLIAQPVNAQRRLAQARKDLSDNVARERWKVEISGVIVNNLYFGTTDREKALLASKVIAAMNLPGADHKYKTAQGWVVLKSSAIIQLGLLIVQFVQDCFDHEGALMELINETDDLSTIDITEGWPSNVFTVDMSGE